MKWLLLTLIKFWQKGLAYLFPNSCRFTPSCSQYFYQAVRQYGILRGSLLGVKRIARCRPGCSGGYDPVK